MDDIIKINGYTFKYNAKEEAYGYVFEIDGNKILAKVYADENTTLNIKNAAKEIDDLDMDALKEYIAKNYYNSVAEDLKISKQDFLDAMDLDIITVDNKFVEFWFDDGGIFGGHNVVVTKWINENKLTIEIAG